MSQSIPTGQEFVSSSGTRWWYDSGAASLDFAYTGGIGEGWERLHTAEDLGAWISARIPGFDGLVAERDLLDARALRGAIARIAVRASIRSTPEADDVDVLNLYAATPDIPPVLAGGGRRAGRSTVRVGQALSALARDAVALFAPDNAERIRTCAADDCGLIFYDESRSNNRRWCSMQRCGNRAKVRRHRSRGIEGESS